MSGSRVFAAYLGDIRFELTKMLRTPMFAVPTLLFPLMFFVLFGVVMGSARGNGQQSLYAFASFGVLGAMAPGLFGFGVSLAFEREQGMLLFRQAVPMPPGSYLLARMAMAMIFVAISSLALIAMGILLAHMPLTFGQCVTFLFMNIFGVLPFCALGMFVGTLVSGQAAPAIINLIYIPMSFLAGLFIPLEVTARESAADRASLAHASPAATDPRRARLELLRIAGDPRRLRCWARPCCSFRSRCAG